jgi:hypothetical protein
LFAYAWLGGWGSHVLLRTAVHNPAEKMTALVIMATHPKAFSNHEATGVIIKMPKRKITSPKMIELPVEM